MLMMLIYVYEVDITGCLFDVRMMRITRLLLIPVLVVVSPASLGKVCRDVGTFR